MAAEKGKPRYTNCRLHEQDARNLSDLADLLGKTISDPFAERFGEKIRTELIAAQERRLADLKRQAKQQG